MRPKGLILDEQVEPLLGTFTSADPCFGALGSARFEAKGARFVAAPCPHPVRSCIDKESRSVGAFL